MWHRQQTCWTHWHLASRILNRIELAWEGRKIGKKCQPDNSLENNSFWLYVTLHTASSTKVRPCISLKANFARAKILSWWPLDQLPAILTKTRQFTVNGALFHLPCRWLCVYVSGGRKGVQITSTCGLGITVWNQPLPSWPSLAAGLISPGPLAIVLHRALQVWKQLPSQAGPEPGARNGWLVFHRAGGRGGFSPPHCAQSLQRISFPFLPG